MQNNKYWFFGSKFNMALLLVLIILMVVAIKIMLRNEAVYFHPFSQNQTEQTKPDAIPMILGNKDDLVSFSILPYAKVSGVVSYKGVVKGAYFFEANILVNVLNANKSPILKGHSMATTDWMTSGPVSFEGKIDFSKLPKGSAYIEIHNDNASDLPANDKSILIPITIE